ncbi:hypothetical protein ACFX16_040582 [Malus domestica]|uniref:Extradiol ring-cleavage dioxygenase class III enzyme subunit B domain-containing protein n=1 Tax=Malus domestica TaxID=3750 RepID=A0A498JDR4_MALDO|nr:hypothetical protein DVH24_013862 [Malus domestica]
MYQIKYPAPGSPHLSNRVKQLLTSSGFGRVDVDTQRGLDHGSWVPQSLRPSFSLSLSILLLLPQSLDPSPVLPPPQSNPSGFWDLEKGIAHFQGLSVDCRERIAHFQGLSVDCSFLAAVATTTEDPRRYYG